MSAKTSTSAHRCPVCDGPTPMSEVATSAPLPSEGWTCVTCQTVLTIDSRANWLLAGLCVIASAAQLLFLDQLGYWFILVPWLGLLWALTRLGRMRVSGDRNPWYCPACRYDLHGTLPRGIAVCPECGCDVRENRERVDRECDGDGRWAPPAKEEAETV